MTEKDTKKALGRVQRMLADALLTAPDMTWKERALFLADAMRDAYQFCGEALAGPDPDFLVKEEVA